VWVKVKVSVRVLLSVGESVCAGVLVNVKLKGGVWVIVKVGVWVGVLVKVSVGSGVLEGVGETVLVGDVVKV
jgi:hypothetical protein